jgi:hypothetical protein
MENCTVNDVEANRPDAHKEQCRCDLAEARAHPSALQELTRYLVGFKYRVLPTRCVTPIRSM